MPITLQRERDNIYRLELRALLRQADLRQGEKELAAEIARVGPVRLLVVLLEFAGPEREVEWEQATFYEAHGDDIERIAIVGPERWRVEMLMFSAAGLRKGAVEYFVESAASEARAWLSA